MTNNDQKSGKKRSEMLTELRRQHQETVKIAQARLKEQHGIRSTLRKSLAAGPQTVPQLAAATGFPAHQVLWYISVMKKYGEVVEAELDENYEYYLYGLARETEK